MTVVSMRAMRSISWRRATVLVAFMPAAGSSRAIIFDRWPARGRDFEAALFRRSQRIGLCRRHHLPRPM